MLTVRRKMNLFNAALKVLALATLVGVASLLSAGASSSAADPENLLSCGTCHSMAEEVMAWQEGAHSNLACMECHLEGNGARVRSEFRKRSGEMVAQDRPHTIALQVAEERCVECHQPQMPYLLKDLVPPPLEGAGAGADPAGAPGQPMAIRAGHDLHQNGEPKLACTDCHVIHGPRAGTPESREAAHSRCQDCHDQEQVAIPVQASVSCVACHVDAAAVAPANHRPEARWLGSHGRADRRTCGECHLDATAEPHGKLARPAAFPTQAGDYCAACHAGVPMPHPAGYLAEHGSAALAAGQAACQTCHSPQNPAQPAPDHARADFCTSCHAGVAMPHPQGFLAGHGMAALAAGQATCQTCHSGQNPVSPGAAHAGEGFCANCHGGLVMPHPDAFLSRHGQESRQAPATCELCHSPQNTARPNAPHAFAGFCGACHDSYQHPAGWVAGHGGQVDESCATCHTLQGQPGSHNSCAACHTGKVWHPKMWFVTHGKAVAEQGEASCQKCHAEVEPSCSKCHRR